MTIENENKEVNDLEVKLSTALNQIDTLKDDLKDIQGHQFICQTCEFKCSSEALLQEHLKKHEPNCKFCDNKFKTDGALEKHTCKLNINNAEYNQFYLKNWILTHGCTGIFNKHQLKEIAVLHTDTCWSHVCPCRELPGWHTSDESLCDEHGIFHGERKEFIENGVVNWSALSKELQD